MMNAIDHGDIWMMPAIDEEVIEKTKDNARERLRRSDG